MKRYTIEHGNVKVHMDSRREVKQYVHNFGAGEIQVYEHKMIFSRTTKSIKVDKL